MVNPYCARDFADERLDERLCDRIQQLSEYIPDTFPATRSLDLAAALRWLLTELRDADDGTTWTALEIRVLLADALLY